MFDKKPICHIFWQLLYRVRPHHEENTGSRLITEVKPSRAMLVLGWVTTQEYLVLQTFFPFRPFCQLSTFFFFFCRNNIVLCRFSHFSFYHANENIAMTLELLFNPFRRSSNFANMSLPLYLSNLYSHEVYFRFQRMLRHSRFQVREGILPSTIN